MSFAALIMTPAPIFPDSSSGKIRSQMPTTELGSETHRKKLPD